MVFQVYDKFIAWDKETTMLMLSIECLKVTAALDSREDFVLDEEFIEEMLLPRGIGCTDCAENNVLR